MPSGSDAGGDAPTGTGGTGTGGSGGTAGSSGATGTGGAGVGGASGGNGGAGGVAGATGAGGGAGVSGAAGSGGGAGMSGASGTGGGGGISGAAGNGGAAGRAGAAGNGGAGPAGAAGNGAAAGRSGAAGATGPGGAAGRSGGGGNAGKGAAGAGLDAGADADVTPADARNDRDNPSDAQGDAGCPNVFGTYAINNADGTCDDLDEDAPQEIRGTDCALHFISVADGGGAAINGGATLGPDGTFSGATLSLGTATRMQCSGTWDANQEEITVICGNGANQCLVELRRSGP